MVNPAAHDTRRWLWCYFGALLLLRVVYAWALGVNTDEPQHLHVVWAWTRGLLPYRDVFDNHTPLFQFLSAPLFAAIGERPQILPLMRIATIPWYALALWCTYRLGRALFDARTGAWAAILVALLPSFFILSAEFRTDVGWAPLWLATLVVAVEGRPTPTRAFFVGLLGGAACAVSLKSSLLLATLALAALGVLGLQRSLGHRLPLKDIAHTAAATLAGFVAIPALIALAFLAAGAWDQFVYCVFVHNVLPGLGHWEHASPRLAIFPVALVPLLALARTLLQRDADRVRGAKRAFVLLGATLYFAALFSYWPLLTRQDFLPFAPIAMVYLVALLFAYRTPQRRIPLRALLPLCAELALLLSYRPPWRDEVQRYVRELADIRQLTDADDYVMDSKGEAIFRRRPFYYALEQITLTRMQLGLIADDIARSMIDTHTAVALTGQQERIPDAAMQFIDANYVPVRPRLRVAGKFLPDASPGAPAAFEIAVPLRYALVTPQGSVAGTLDGTPYREPRTLDAGTHVFVPESPGRVAVIWAQAMERGFSPFTTQADDETPH